MVMGRHQSGSFENDRAYVRKKEKIQKDKQNPIDINLQPAICDGMTEKPVEEFAFQMLLLSYKAKL